MAEADLFLFVSHVNEDRPAALEIVAELERRGVPCWIAPRNVRPGRPFDNEIAGAIETCRAMLLIFSDHCNESEYIRREVTVAGDVGKMIIPFRIENARPKSGLRVRLSDLHWIDGFVSRERAIDELVGTISPGVQDIRPVPTPGEDVRDAPTVSGVAAEHRKPMLAGPNAEPASAADRFQRRGAVDDAAEPAIPAGPERTADIASAAASPGAASNSNAVVDVGQPEGTDPRRRALVVVGVIALGLALAMITEIGRRSAPPPAAK